MNIKLKKKYEKEEYIVQLLSSVTIIIHKIIWHVAEINEKRVPESQWMMNPDSYLQKFLQIWRREEAMTNEM